MRAVTRLDGEDRVEVTNLLVSEGVLLEGSDDGIIDGLLEGLAFIRDLGGLLGFLLTASLGRLAGLTLSGTLGLISHEVSLALLGADSLGTLEHFGGDLAGIDTLEVYLGGCGDEVTSVDTAEWDTVHLEGAGDDERTVLGELLHNHDTASTEATSEHDTDGSRGDGLARSEEHTSELQSH